MCTRRHSGGLDMVLLTVRDETSLSSRNTKHDFGLTSKIKKDTVPPPGGAEGRQCGIRSRGSGGIGG